MSERPELRVLRRAWPELSAPERASLVRIYEGSFPPAERNPLSRFQGGELRFWLGLDGNDEVLGFCAVGSLGDCAYLQYLAVAPRRRNDGIGAHLLDVLAHDVAAAGQRGIVLEIEDPARAEDDPFAQRRREFYGRWDAVPLTGLTGYYIPDRVEPDSAVPMLLLWRPSRADTAPPAGDELRSLLRRLYAFEYAEFAPADYLSQVLAGVRSGPPPEG